MRNKELISESVVSAAKNVAVVVLLFAALLVVLWGLIAVVRFVLG